jgi:hypothetical protein
VGRVKGAVGFSEGRTGLDDGSLKQFSQLVIVEDAI